MKDQNSIDVTETSTQKYERALDLFTESVMKPDHDLRGCAHNQGCYEQLMDIREHVLEYLKSLKNQLILSNSIGMAKKYTDDQFEEYLNKYGYEYTPTVTDDKPTHRGRIVTSML